MKLLRSAQRLARRALGIPGGWFNLTGGSGGGESLREPYRSSTWVNRAIKLVAQPIAEVPLRISTDARGGRQLLADPELLRWWETPAIGPDKRPMSACDFAECTISWLKLCGSAFWVLDDTVFAAPAKLPFPEAGLTFPRLLIARPDRMQPQISQADNSLLAWRFTDGAGRQFTLDPMQVVHLRLFNPYDDHRGLAEMDAAQVPAESDYLAGVFKRNLWRANGDRGPFVIVDQPLDDAQQKQLTAQLEEKRRLGAQGIFKMGVLGGNFKIEDPKTQTVDAAFVAARPEDRHEVFVAFGVPPSMADIVASYSIGSASDWYRLIRDTCIPTGRKFTEAIEQVLKLQRPGQTLFAWLDWKSHPVMQETLRELIEPATKMWDRGMPWERINEWLGLNLPEFDGWDTGYLPFSVAPADSAALDTPTTDPAADPNYQEPDETSLVQEMQRALQARRKRLAASDQEPCGCPACDGAEGNEQRARPARELALWKKHAASRQPAIRRYETAFTRELFKARQATLKKLEALSGKSVAHKAAAVDFLFSLADFKAGLLGAMRNAGRAALLDAGTQFFAEAGKDDPFTMPPIKALQFLQARDNKIAGVAENTWERIRATLVTGFEAGQSPPEIAKAIRAEFNDISKGRAKVIALTETSAAYGVARQEAMVQSGVQFKQWLTSGSSNVRAAHELMNGQVVPVSEKFHVTNPATGATDLVDGPGDYTGEPWNVINCHCVAIAVSNAEGDII